MKYLLFFIVLCIAATNTYAQIFATTSSGKKVILNTDGTWKYAEGGQDEKPCAKNHIGNVAIKNATGSDLYFYYSTSDYGKAEFVKIKADATKTIYDLYVGSFSWNGTLTSTHNYKWKATLELVENTSTFAYIKGAIEEGSFMVDECSLKEITIGE